MNLTKVVTILVLVINCVFNIYGFVDPVTLAVGGAVVGVISYLYKNPETKEATVNFAYKAYDKTCQMLGYCEGCEDYWIHSNIQGLEYELKSTVFGQSLAIEMILSSLKSHLNTNRKPTRALVLSFQGSPGTGKNYVSQKILENIFKKGGGSRYVKFFRGSNDFPLHSEVHKYKKDLTKTIKQTVYECHRSVFIFDEVEKMPNGILDVISGFVNTGLQNQIDFRRVIFILLSNVGSEELNKETLQAWHHGIPREDMSFKTLTNLLATSAYNSEGGLKESRLVKNHEVTLYVPFLPLEKLQVIKCLEQEVKKRNQIMSTELRELVLEELTFYPKDSGIFAVAGCKNVGEKADYLIEKEIRKIRQSRKSLI